MKHLFNTGKLFVSLLFTCGLIFISSASLSLQAYAAPRLQPVDEKIVIVIDPGHGGDNEGTAAAIPPMEPDTKEKEMTMITAQAMYDELSKYDNVEVYLTRTGDEDINLKDRAQLAADVNADFLFSIHYNASLNHELFGSEVWISDKAPFHAYGYQFGEMQMRSMQDMGLFLRGIKTRLNEENLDYYGIIREAVALDVPAAIIEHCHVDEERDVPFCETKEQWEAFGRADALSVAKYFGLSSTSLSVDYSEDANSFTELSENAKVQRALEDKTAPDVCELELLKADYDTGEITVSVSAADYDTPLIYYDYSIDGGNTYTRRESWPETNVLTGSYPDTITLNLQIPSGVFPDVSVRVYNLYDLDTESNRLQSFELFRHGDSDEEAVMKEETEKPLEYETEKLPGTTTFRPAESDEVLAKKEVDFTIFLGICLFIAAAMILTALISLMRSRSRRKRRR